MSLTKSHKPNVSSRPSCGAGLPRGGHHGQRPTTGREPGRHEKERKSGGKTQLPAAALPSHGPRGCGFKSKAFDTSFLQSLPEAAILGSTDHSGAGLYNWANSAATGFMLQQNQEKQNLPNLHTKGFHVNLLCSSWANDCAAPATPLSSSNEWTSLFCFRLLCESAVSTCGDINSAMTLVCLRAPPCTIRFCAFARGPLMSPDLFLLPLAPAHEPVASQNLPVNHELREFVAHARLRKASCASKVATLSRPSFKSKSLCPQLGSLPPRQNTRLTDEMGPALPYPP